ncbi:MAG: TolC family protein [Prevotella sp.]|nr:TolC family protein [Prevotella sp.]
MRYKIIGIVLLTAGMTQAAAAQRLLSLDSCRAMALRNNKQMSVSKVKQEIAANLRKSARTKYLPHISALGGYEWTSREISLLSDEQKETLSHLGTGVSTNIGNQLNQTMAQMPQGVWSVLGALGITPESLQQQFTPALNNLAGLGNGIGQKVVDAFHTDTRNMFAGSVMLTQPVFMGGAIIAMNKLADINEEMMANSAETRRQQTLYNIDQAYWQVVSLRHKQKLAQAYYDLVQKLDGDVQKMIREGVATRSEGLSVSVKVNEAEMALTKVNDGLVLSKMLLCQLCGLPLREQVTLADEESDELAIGGQKAQVDMEAVMARRPELKQLQNMVDMSRQLTNILKAGNLPQVLLTGGYVVTNPNLFNSFQRKFGGMWNIGVLVRIPIWNWGDVAYKVRASKGATTIANLEMEEVREKIELQVSQSAFQVDEANKKLAMAKASTAKADENLRTANLGFREGVISSTTVMEAQTAWLQAQSQKIDAEIDVKLSQVNLQKALGVLQ